MVRFALVLMVLAGCGSGPELRDISGTLDPVEVEPFLKKLAAHSDLRNG